MDDEKFRILEERIAWLQRHVTEQDKAMMQMADRLRKLETLASSLQERLRESGGPGEGAGGLPVDERPPHY
ncbi:SlyX [mine drainage metagenome]|uniref:SlyX n=1 Tax=mine drainage metagenome TaxID=410659 RepID=A0A1J5SID3_9ZZZZ